MEITQTDRFMVIDFMPEGTVEAMHRDTLNLGFLGRQSITRASDIRFNDDTQSWDIWLAEPGRIEFVDVSEAHGFDSYEEARTMEVRWLELCRLHDLKPLTQEGRNLLVVLRKRFED